jgi:hypothetical protein
MHSLDAPFTSFVEAAERKVRAMRANPLGFTIAAAFAGAYVGAGILLIFSVGEPLDPSFRPLLMGASFGIASTLVVFAGAELFTGHTLSMTVGRLEGRIDSTTLLRAWVRPGSGTSREPWSWPPCSSPAAAGSSPRRRRFCARSRSTRRKLRRSRFWHAASFALGSSASHFGPPSERPVMLRAVS